MLYTCEDIANRYGVNTTTVNKWIRLKKITVIKIGNAYRITEEALKEFERRNTIDAE